jgi:hypothetical protein
MTMHNWYGMQAFGRERAAELTRLAESIRTAREAGRRNRLQAKAIEPALAKVRHEFFPTERDMKHARATFVIERGGVLSVHAGHRPYRIGCVAGRLWATIEGSTVDDVLVAGQTLTYHGRGRVVIQALRTATVRVECPSSARVFLISPLRPAFQLG